MNRPTGRSPWPGKQRKCRLHDSTSRSSCGASASCTRKMRSPGIEPIGAHRKAGRERVKAVEQRPIDGMIGPPHDLPGVAVIVDVAAPGQRLEADTQGLAVAARSPSARKSSAARSMPPSEAGETLLQISSRSVPSSCIRSNLRSARAKLRARCGSGMPSKSRNGWNAQIARPRSRHRLPTSRGLPSKDSRSFSKISTASNPAAAMARSFSSRAPLSETVAIERVRSCCVAPPWRRRGTTGRCADRSECAPRSSTMRVWPSSSTMP